MVIGVFFAYHFINYSLKVNYLEKQYENRTMALEINSYLHSNFNATSQIIRQNEFEKYLKNFGNPNIYNQDYFLFNDDSYHLKIDQTKKRVLLYSFGSSKKDNNLRNVIDLRLYGNNDGNYKQNFSFWNYLKNGDYDLLLVDKTFNFECNEIYNTLVFIDGKGIIRSTSPNILEIEKMFRILLNEVDLIDGTVYRNAPSKRIVYIYDGKQLKNMCPTEFVLDKKREEKLFRLIKDNFPDYSYIKFLVAEGKDNN